MALDREEKIVLAVVGIVGVTAVGLLIYSRTAKAAALPSGQRPAPGAAPALPPVTVQRASTPVPPPVPTTHQFTADEIRRYKRILKGLQYDTVIPDFVVNGFMDVPFQRAIQMFQGAYNTERTTIQSHRNWEPQSLTVDGVLGPRTAQALEHYVDFLAAE